MAEHNPMYYFCTYFDRHYIEKGLALYYSLVRHCSPFQLWILCMDDVTYHILSEMRLPQVHLIPLTTFERDDPLLRQAKLNRSLIEYYFTCTPSLPIYVLDHASEVDVITYLDADLYFFSSIEPIYRELGDKSVLIVEHRFPSALKNREIFGIYNVGLLSFRRDGDGLACLHWWRGRCLDWCYDRVEPGRFADQKYLDDWPDRFSKTVVSRHKGVGLAPWNITNYKYSLSGKDFFVDDQPLIVYHFQGLRQLNTWLYDSNIEDYNTRLPKIVKSNLYYPYIMELEHIKRELECSFKFNLDRSHPIRIADKANLPASVSVWDMITNSVNNGINYLKIFQKLFYNGLILLDHK